MAYAARMLARFAADRRGNFAMMMSLAAIPVLFGIGLAVDITGIASTKSSLQNANDAAVLFAARERQVKGSLPGQDKLEDFLSANFDGEIVSAAIRIEGENIILDTKARADLYIFSAFGDFAPDVAVRSAAPVASNTVLEVALALDTTYSMVTDDKIGGLKAAATDFVNLVMATAGPDNVVKIGVVPFANYVNVGLGYRNEPWLSVPPDSNQIVPAHCANEPEIVSKSNCRMETAYSDGVPYQYEACDYVYGPDKEVCYPESTQLVKWWGCVGDRDNPHTLTDKNPNIPFPGMMDAWDMTTWACPTPIQTLSTSKSTVLSSIDGLTPRGETYIVDGVTWGMRLLTPAVPFDEGVDPAHTTAKVTKVMVLMSDGDNTMSSQLPDYYGHWGTDVTRSNAWTKEACDNARDEGIEIYSITFGKEVSANGKDVMENCADDADHYFDATSSAALAKAFKDIAGRLTRVRLTM